MKQKDTNTRDVFISHQEDELEKLLQIFFFFLSDVLCDEKLIIRYGCTLDIGFNPLVHCLDFLVCLCLSLAFGKEILK